MPRNSTSDANQNATLVAYAGTAGTSDTRGTSDIVGLSADPTTGAQYVYNLGPAGSVSLGNINDGTVAVRPQAGGDPGTALTVRLTDGTSFYNASGAGGGTSVQIVHGTIESSGTTTGVGVVTTVTNLSHGTVENSGTVTGVGVLSSLTNGTVRVSAGTVGGAGATAVALSGNPIPTGGVDVGGTVYGFAVDLKGQQLLGGGTIDTISKITSGTIQNSGTVTGVGVLSALTSGTVSVNTPGTITSGSISIIAGTIGAGTFNTLGTVSKILAGTIQNSGTVTGVGVVSALTSGTVSVNTPGTITSGTVVTNQNSGTLNVGTINVGSVSGRGANAAATVGFPVLTGGMDGGGTTYTFLTDTAGHMKNDMISGTLNLGTMTMTLGTLNAGTINSGTINAGTMTMTVGTLNAGTINTGTINAGTIRIDPLPVTDSILTVGTTGTTAIGTLIGTATIGVGTGVYIQGFHIMAISGTPEVNLAFGTQKVNNQVIAHGLFPPGGGIARDKPFAHAYGTTQSPLTYEIISGAGTVSWSVDYFLHT